MSRFGQVLVLVGGVAAAVLVGVSLVTGDYARATFNLVLALWLLGIWEKP